MNLLRSLNISQDSQDINEEVCEEQDKLTKLEKISFIQKSPLKQDLKQIVLQCLAF